MNKGSKTKKKSRAKSLWIFAAVGAALVVASAAVFVLRDSVWVQKSIDEKARVISSKDVEPVEALSLAYRMAPSRIKRSVSPGKETYLFSVQNSSRQEARVVLSFYKSAIQSLDGSLVVKESQEAKRRGERFLRLSESDFLLGPGEVKNITGKVLQKPRGEALTGMLYASFAPESLEEDEINTAIRLGAFTELRFAGYKEGRARLLEVLPTPSEDGRVDFRLQAENQGTSGLARPKGEISIYSSKGKLVWTDDVLYGQGVLPGQRRDLRLEEPSVAISPGSYTVEGSLSGEGFGSKQTRFTVEQDGSLPEPSLAMDSEISGDKFALDQPWSAKATLVSTSSEEFPAIVRARVFALASEKVVARKSVQVGSLAPSSLRRESIKMRPLYQSGDFLLLLEALDEEGGVLAQEQQSFRVLPTKDDFAYNQSLGTWLANHPEATLLAGMLLALLGFGVIVLYFSLRSTRQREERIQRRQKQAKSGRTRKRKR